MSLIMVSVFFLTGCDDPDPKEKIKEASFKYTIACLNHENSRDKFMVDDYYYQNKELTLTYFNKEKNMNVSRTFLNTRCWIKPNMNLVSESEKLEYKDLVGDGKVNYVLKCRQLKNDGHSKFYANKYIYDGYQIAFVDNDTKELYKLLNPACVIDKT